MIRKPLYKSQKIIEISLFIYANIAHKEINFHSIETRLTSNQNNLLIKIFICNISWDFVNRSNTVALKIWRYGKLSKLVISVATLGANFKSTH